MTLTYMSVCMIRIEDRGAPDPERLWSYCSFSGNPYGLEDHYKAKGYDILYYTRLPPPLKGTANAHTPD